MINLHRHAVRANSLAIFALAAAIETSICVWAFLILPLIPIAWPSSMPVIQFVSSGVLQLVALPILAVAGRKSNAEVLALIRETHDMTMETHADVKESVALLHKKLDGLTS